jgi:hypothetical protein
MTSVKRLTGTVRFGNSFPAPSSNQTVRVILTDMNNKRLGFEEFMATEVIKEPQSFSFAPLSAGTGYRLKVEVGPYDEVKAFSLPEEGDPAPIDFLIGSDD